MGWDGIGLDWIRSSDRIGWDHNGMDGKGRGEVGVDGGREAKGSGARGGTCSSLGANKVQTRHLPLHCGDKGDDMDNFDRLLDIGLRHSTDVRPSARKLYETAGRLRTHFD